MTHTLIQAIDATLTTLRWHQERETSRDARAHYARLKQLADQLPSGSGLDRGTKIDLDRSRADRIVLIAPFHHMNEHGHYDGWTDHVIIVRPAFGGIQVDVRGRNRNGIKDYLAEVYHHALLEVAR